MSFVSVLKSHVDNSCVMLYGSVTDNIISADLCYREFSVALHDILKECGYDNIVFSTSRVQAENMCMMIFQHIIV